MLFWPTWRTVNNRMSILGLLGTCVSRGRNSHARGLLFTQDWSLKKLVSCDVGHAVDPRRNDIHYALGIDIPRHASRIFRKSAAAHHMQDMLRSGEQHGATRSAWLGKEVCLHFSCLSTVCGQHTDTIQNCTLGDSEGNWGLGNTVVRTFTSEARRFCTGHCRVSQWPML